MHSRLLVPLAFVYALLIPVISRAQTDTLNVYFAFNDTTLSLQAKSTLDAAVLQTDFFRKGVISILGYTDNAGGNSYNNKLSWQRARSVKAYMDANYLLPVSVEQYNGKGKMSHPDTAGTYWRAEDRVVHIIRRLPDEVITIQPVPDTITAEKWNRVPKFICPITGDAPSGFEEFVKKENRKWLKGYRHIGNDHYVREDSLHDGKAKGVR